MTEYLDNPGRESLETEVYTLDAGLEEETGYAPSNADARSLELSYEKWCADVQAQQDHQHGQSVNHQEDQRMAQRLGDVAGELIDGVKEQSEPTDGYRRLLHKAMMVAAEAQRELYRRDQEIKSLRQLSMTDETTKLLNRRGFDIAFDRALGRARRTDERGLLLIIDLDGFKAVNDTFGHMAGDMVLATVATMLRVNTREIDDVARIGGDEFAVLLNGADSILGYQKAAQLDVMLNNMTVDWDNRPISVRGSVGMAPFGAQDDPSAIIRQADATMYGQKRRAEPRLNRNTITVKTLPKPMREKQ